MALKAAFHNLGCRVNAYETEAMIEQLKRAGYELVPFDAGADIYVVNTCTVTHIADRKSRQMLHRAREWNPHAIVIAVGCYVEDAGEALIRDGAVDLMIGNHAKSRLAEILARYMAGSPETVYTEPIQNVKHYDELSISETEGRTRAFLKIQDGCNQFCSYCMIPYVRGRARSRRPEEVLREAERLARAGYRELVLTGIHVSSYGIDFSPEKGRRQTPDASEAVTNRELLHLFRGIAAIPDVKRLRFGSLEPGIMTEEFVQELARNGKLCPQFHLSLQSGCDATLRRMKRKYNTKSFEAICRRLRSAFPDPAISTDVIVGFPGESEEEFEESYAFVERMQFSGTHIFKYSVRRGTAAAKMPGQVAEEDKARRSDRMIALGKEASRRYAERFQGRMVEVLFEEQKQAEGRSLNSGHSKEALEVLCETEEPLSGQIWICRVQEVRPDVKAEVSLERRLY